ncbi:MMPL family transporter [Streptomyces sp. NPDC018031]|uniref:MMPL family transporter n=1 Tax=Streptomyces sp. NPDC018031 TaxID=3365033 RepID=UPI0037AEFB15
MLIRLADLTIRRPKRVLLITLLVVIGAGILAAGLTSRLTMGGYESSETESARAAEVLEDHFGQGAPNLVILVADSRGVDHADVASAGASLTDRVSREKGVSNVVSYWTSKSPAMRGTSGDEALVLGRIDGDFDTVQDRSEELKKEYSGTVHGLEVKLGGSGLMWQENLSTAAEDALKAEAVVVPVVLLLLVIIFRSVPAALVPLAVAIATTVVVMGILFVISLFLETSDLVTNVTTFLGLGLAVDYCLLFITRYREELAGGSAIPEAIRTTMQTVGRTVIFSATTLAVALGSMLALPFTIFHSAAIGAISTGLVSAAATLVIAPALLVWMGPRIDSLRLGRGRAAQPPAGGGFWRRLALFVMRRPVPILLAVVAFLLLLASPARDMKLRLPDEQVLPASAQSAQVAKAVGKGFDNRELDVLQVVAEDTGGDPAGRRAEIDAYAARLSKIENVARVDALTGSYSAGRKTAPPNAGAQRFAVKDATYLSLVPKVDAYGESGERLVRAVRGTEAPFPVRVGGTPAVSVDTFDLLGDRLPIALIILAIGSFVLLFLLTGSVLLPIKAILMSALSLSATFGALVYIFQEGNLTWLVGDFVVTGAITWLVPIIVIAIAFALSLDYAVFILSRIMEEYRRTHKNEEAVAVGLERTGRVVTYAALVLSLVFIALVPSSISYMKAIGIGLPLAVLLDATLVRGLLVPAFMRLLGKANWWAPGPLRRIHARFGINESHEVKHNVVAPGRPEKEVNET